MSQRLQFLYKTLLYYFSLFVVAKLLFLIYQFRQSSQLPLQLWFKSIIHGLQMDLAMSAYVIMVFSLLLAFSFFLTGKGLRRLLKMTNLIILIPFLLVIILDLEIYRNWGFHLDTTPFQYLKTPEAAAASTPIYIYVLMLTLFAGTLTLSSRLFNKHVLNNIAQAKPSKFYTIPVYLIIGGAMIIPARGGFDVQPMNTSFVYYSSNIFANHVAVNPVWNFLYALDHMDNLDQNYDFTSNQDAHSQFQTMMADGGQTTPILNTTRPNIVLIVLESFSSDLLEMPDIAPNLCRYSQEGLFFSNFYAVAGRSDKGLSAILSGYPAHPGDAIIKNSNKVEKMPNLGQSFKDMGYTNAFYYGGDINFANLNSYLNISRFDKLVTKADYPSSSYGAKWGVHDEYVFERFFNDIQDMPSPFFSTLYTLSSHEPFDVPEHIIKGESTKQKFLNTALYTDKHLGLFIDKLKASPLWDSTLVIITADHGSTFINPYKGTEKARYHIPLIWLGGVLKSDSTVTKYGSQTDIIATLLHQLEAPSEDFIFSKNLLSDGTKGFGYYTYRGGAGYLDDNTYQVYDNNAEMYLTNEGKSNTSPGRVYLQISYNYFLNK